jgi:hypothetical protein
MSKIIKFPSKQEEDLDQGSMIIDANQKSPMINNVLDYFWNEVYTGRTIKGISADDDGKITIDFMWSKYQNYHFESLIGFLDFTINFMNNNKQLIGVFLEKYNEHVDVNGYERLITSGK